MSINVAAEDRSAELRSGETRNSSTSSIAWYSLTLDDAFERLQSDVTQGLTQAEAAGRLAKYGPNTLAQALQRSTLDILLAQFRSIIVALLAAATVIAFAMGDSIEAMAILVVIVINAAIGFFTEWKAAH